jgi:two-component system nitrate/nitrite response regulator NarL
MRCTSVVIADRHPVLLQGLNRVLGAEPDFNIVASCGAGADCIDAIRRFGPDIAIVDVAMPGLAGLKILSLVNSNRLSTQVVFFAATVEDCELVTSAAVNGYSIILKDVVPKALVQSLRRIAGGQRLLPLPSSDHAGSREHSVIAENALTMLTDRERQIMRLVSEGLSNKEIGRRLNIADGTIKVHLHNIFQKLEISNRTVLAALAISQNDNVDIRPGRRDP